MRFLSLLCLSLFLCASLMAGAQVSDENLNRLADRYQPEKIHLHYDKASYLPGETIWFKAYLMEGLYPALNSKTLYIDWISEKGEVLNHTVAPVVDGASNGQFNLPSDFTGSLVHVKAYTKWMLNFDTALLYTKTIRVLGTTAPRSAAAAPVYALRFFPEGGDLVAGISNRLAFKATDQWGRPVAVRGVINDNSGNRVDSFRTTHNGMGYLVMIPKEGVSYSARWKEGKSAEQTTALPAAKGAGIAMQVGLTGTRRVVQLFGTPGFNAGQKFHLLGTINQRTAFRSEVTFNSDMQARRVIETATLPSGVLTITLFDESWKPLAERITFVYNNDFSFKPRLEVQRWGMNKRARNEIQITLPDSMQATTLSVSVTDASLDRDTASNIFSQLMLTSDIKGYVHNPAAYFGEKTEQSEKELDLVMLTNGWRRFKWEDIAKGKMPQITYQRDTAYLALSGNVLGVVRGQLSTSETLTLLVKSSDTSTQLLFMPVKPDGSFRDPSAIFFDTLRVHYHMKSKTISNPEVRFMPDRLPAPNYVTASRNFIPFATQTDTLGSYRHAQLGREAFRIRQQALGKTLENVTVTARKKPPLEQLDDKYARGMFKGADALQYDFVNDPLASSQLSVFNYLRGRVPGLQITGVSPPVLSWRGGTPQIYVDEVLMDAEFAGQMPVGDIAYVKVFRPPFMGGPGGGTGGAIAIYTRKGDEIKSSPGKGLNSNVIMGYSPIREFYSPNYASFEKRHEERDVRTTLYWSPMLGTNGKKQTASFHFYNNDVTKAFRVVIEGMTKDGLLTHYEEILE